MEQVRAPTQPPSSTQYCQLQILFRHPGYDDGSNVLFKLQALETNDDGQPGLYAQLAIDACVIITGDYASQGWLSLLRVDSAPIDPTSTLRERSYYFHLNATDDPYPVVPNFHQWIYPHDRLPLHWQQLTPNANAASSNTIRAPSNLSTALRIRDGSCRLSGYYEQVQVAHIVPQSELDWWEVNEMSRYNKGSTATLDDPANALLLRADLHIAFDEPCFALVPKPATDGSMRLVAHLLEYSPELKHLHHNRELHPAAVGVNMLYARFAWSVFKLLDAFLKCKVDRRLTLRASESRLADARGFVTADDCELFSNAVAKKRAQSPRKHKPERDTVTEVESTAKTPTRTSQKRILDVQAEDTPSNVITAKRAHSEDVSTHMSVSSPLGRQSSFELLVQTQLEFERKRSDPDGTWNEERKWIKDVWGGKTLAANEIERWFEAIGHEVRDM